MNKNGWTYKKLGEVCEYAKTRINSRDISIENYIGVDNLLQNCQGRSLATKVPDGLGLTEYWEGDVLIGNIRPYLRKIWLADCRGGCNGDVLAIRRKHEYTSLIDTSYLYKCLSTNYFFDLAMQYAKGEKMPRGDKKEILNYLIPIPTIAEQERIVAELDLLSGIIEKKKEQLKAYDQLAQSIFYTMFGDILNASPTLSLKDIASYIIGLTYKPSDVCETGTIVLRSSNIQNNLLDFKDTVRVSVDIKDNKYVQDGDILMCARNGSAKLVGKVARIKNLSEKTSFGAFMTIIRSDYNDYLFHFFLSDYFRNQLTTSKTATINQITSRMLDNIKLNIPSLSLQEEFAEKVEEIERQKALVQQSIEETQTMFDYTMDKYFG